MGFFLHRPDLGVAFFHLAYLGYFSKLAICGFAAYVLGLLLATSVIGVVGGLGALLGVFLGSRLKNSWQPWKNLLWRETAVRFIGKEFTPAPELPISEDVFNAQIASLPKTSIPGTSIPDMTLALNAMTDQNKRIMADVQWHSVYYVLEEYFAVPVVDPSIGAYMGQAAHCAAWALIILMSFGILSHLLTWTMCISVILGVFLDSFLAYGTSGVANANADRQTALMLKVLNRDRTHDSQQTAPISNAGAERAEGIPTTPPAVSKNE